MNAGTAGVPRPAPSRSQLRIFLDSPALLALCLCASPLAAQRIRGQVFLPDSATAARGIIVVASDEKGRPLVSALTSERGDFELLLPAAGHADLRALRIGFRPTLVPAVTLGPGETRTVRIVLNGEAVSLAAVTVRGKSVCRAQQDSGQLVAKLWEEARKALVTTQLSSSAGRLRARWVVYDSTGPGSTAKAMTAGTSRTKAAYSDHPFVSIPSDSLAHAGYVQRESDGSFTYFAPDATVLLSDSFAELHCFNLEPPAADHREWVGVGFRPARERAGITDINGTLWLDRASAELRLLDFAYSPQPQEYDAAHVGATLEFLRLAAGNWLVNRWVIRMPLATRSAASPGIGGRLAPREGRLVVNAVQASGGEVTHVERGRDVLYATAQPSRADSVVLSPGSAMALPPCAPDEVGRNKALLHGVLLDAARRPVAGAAVSVEWKAQFSFASGRGVSWTSKRLDTASNSAGLWVFCGAPRATPLALRVTHLGRMAGLEVLIPADRAVATVEVGIP